MMRIKWSIIGILMVLTASIKAEYQKNILVLHSYHQGLMWTDHISKGISQVFLDYPEYELEYRYLNARRNFDKKYLKKQEEIIVHDILTYNYDAVIVSDNAAFNFLKTLSDSVLGTTPVVCCGINGIDINPFSDNCHIIHEDLEFVETFDMISSLMPELDTLLIINDKTAVGQNVKDELIFDLQDYDCPFEIVYFDEYTLFELRARVNSLSDNTAIYLLVFNQDQDGNYISYNYGLQTIDEFTRVPIFGAWDFYMHKGIVGGKVVRGQNHGRVAAKACVKLLQSGALDAMDLQAINKFKVDYPVMKRLGLKLSSLPAETIIDNRPDRKIFVRLFYGVLLAFFAIVFVYHRNKKYLQRVVYKRTRELKLALNNKDQFFSLLAHDLRSPTGTLAEGLKFLEQNGEKLSEKRRELMLKELTKTSSRVYHLLEDLLIWGRFQFSSDYHAQHSTFHLKPLVDDVCEVYYLEKKKSLFHNEVPSTIELHSDSFVLKFILRNLISNAIKFSEDDSPIVIGADYYHDIIRFWVKDAGQGMSQEVVRSILENAPIQSQGVKGQKSFGLGLRSVQAYLKELNGEMRIESNESGGSCFYILLKNT